MSRFKELFLVGFVVAFIIGAIILYRKIDPLFSRADRLQSDAIRGDQILQRISIEQDRERQRRIENGETVELTNMEKLLLEREKVSNR